MRKKLLSLTLALALCLGLTVPAFAAELKMIEVPTPVVEEYETKDYSLGVFHEGLAWLFLFDSNGTIAGVGFIDWTGKIAIPPNYDWAGPFSEGFAAVQQNGKWGFIDKTGELVVPYKYDDCGNFFGGFAAVKLSGKWGYVDKTGKEVVSCIYDDAWSFTQGLVAVKKSGKWGFIDTTGKEVIPFQYNDAMPFSEGLAGVQKNGKWGFIDKAGEAVIDFQYDQIGNFSEGLAAVVKNSKGGFIDKTGELVIPCQYDSVSSFSEGLAAVVQNGKWGYIDKTGKMAFSCKYGNVGPFSGGFAAVQMYDSEGYNMGGYIDRTGKEVVPPEIFTENGVKYFRMGDAGGAGFDNEGYATMTRISIDDKNPNNPKSKTIYFTLTVDAKVSDWAREQVDSAAVKGLMPDCLGDDFTENITRAEFAALAVELYEAMSGETAPAPGESPFSDTNDPVIIQANALGIVGGMGDGTFAPDKLVTREQAALMLSRVYTKLGGEIPEVEATTFADNSKVSSWAMDAVAFMADQEIVNGVGGNKFDPQGNASIEQALIIALRMFEDLRKL